MNILSIETSCDETAIAILSVGSGKNPTAKVLSHTVSSQIEIHAQYGGVFPMMAKREHAKNIFPVFVETLQKAKMFSILKNSAVIPDKKVREILARENELVEIFATELPKIKKPKIDRIAITVGPGLTPALWVGISFAKALSLAWNIPIVPVNHMEGHILSTITTDKNNSFKLSSKNYNLPAISLLVSGGHTEIVLFKDIGKYKVVGQTRDDAAGEAFDKVARMLGLTYPGGPQVSKLADEFRKSGAKKSVVLPRPMMHTKDFDFSFSGLKTSVLYLIRDLSASGGLGEIDQNKKIEIACEFEDAVVDVLTKKTFAAVSKYKAKSIIVGGGVSANKELKKRFIESGKKLNVEIFFPEKELCTDNAIMIAIAGYYGKSVPLSSKKLIAVGNLEL
jgi:N6-L-threonylcarbamoyladenine synthase